MDSNFFEYLIIIFFIVSALQSFLGKKKKQQQKERDIQNRRSEKQPYQTPGKGRQEVNPKDIFEQMFGIEIPDKQDQTGKQTKIPSDTNTEVLDPREYHDTSWNPEEEFEDSVGVETVRYEENRDEAKVKYTNVDHREKAAELDAKVKEARESLQRLPDKIEVEELNTSISVSFVENIKTKIRQPQTIREYILVSEILKKPKALRR
jgi:hypothetical protein